MTWFVDDVSAPGKRDIELFTGQGDCTTQAEIEGCSTGDKETGTFSLFVVCSSSTRGFASAYLIRVVDEPHAIEHAPLVSCVGGIMMD